MASYRTILSAVCVACAAAAMGSAQAETRQTYFYDALGRLQASTDASATGGGRTRYALDAAGNRSQAVMEIVSPRAAQDRLAAYESLLVGQALISADHRFSFILQVDGNAVIYGPSGPVWANYSTSGRSTVLAMQADGNVVIRGPANEAVWDTGTSGHPGSVLIMQNDGNLVLYQNWTPVWASGTGWY